MGGVGEGQRDREEVQSGLTDLLVCTGHKYQMESSPNNTHTAINCHRQFNKFRALPPLHTLLQPY